MTGENKASLLHVLFRSSNGNPTNSIIHLENKAFDSPLMKRAYHFVMTYDSHDKTVDPRVLRVRKTEALGTRIVHYE